MAVSRSTARHNEVDHFMHFLAAPFWNQREARLRAGWRVALQLAVWIYGPLLFNRWLSQPLANRLSAALPQWTPLFVETSNFFISAVVVLISTWLIARYVDRRPFADLGFHIDRVWRRDLGFGVILGGCLMAGVFAIERLLGWVRVAQVLPEPSLDLPFLAAVMIPLIAFAVISVTEELLSSGYQVRNLAEGFNLPGIGAPVAILLAWGISSVIFAWLHIVNPNSSLFSTFNLFVLGLFFGLGYVLTGSLAIPIGLHFSWNLFQGTVFGFPVSGRSFGGVSLIAIEQSGPAIWTGGPFGPEAGLIGLAAMAVGAAMTAWHVRRRSGQLTLYAPLTRFRPLADRADTSSAR